MALSKGAYIIAWQYGNKRGQRKEAKRIEALRASGWLKENAGAGGGAEGDVEGGIHVMWFVALLRYRRIWCLGVWIGLTCAGEGDITRNGELAYLLRTISSVFALRSASSGIS